jgi:hypothetical protein
MIFADLLLCEGCVALGHEYTVSILSIAIELAQLRIERIRLIRLGVS